MMKMTTMAKIVDTLDDARHSSTADQIAARFGVAKGVASFFRASANFVFVCRKGEERFFLRFNEDSERSRSLIEAEISVLNWLIEQGLPIAAPVLSPGGNYVETVATELGTYHAVLFTGLEGETLEVETMQASQFRNWGEALGKLHSVLQNCPDELITERPAMANQLSWVETIMPADHQAGQRELALVKTWARELNLQRDDFGLIHYDFEQDNLLWRDGCPSMLDFDDCARYPWVADIAYALRDLFETEIDLQNSFFLEFIDGYRQHKAISEAMLSQLPMCMRVHNLVTYARLSNSVGLPDGYEGKLGGLNSKLMRIRDKLLSGFAE